MTELKEKIKQLSDYLEQMDGVQVFSNYVGKQPSFKIYHSISGFLNDEYFSFTISMWGDQHIEVKIDSSNDCESIEDIINKFDLC